MRILIGALITLGLIVVAHLAVTVATYGLEALGLSRGALAVVFPVLALVGLCVAVVVGWKLSKRIA